MLLVGKSARIERFCHFSRRKAARLEGRRELIDRGLKAAVGEIFQARIIGLPGCLLFLLFRGELRIFARLRLGRGVGLFRFCNRGQSGTDESERAYTSSGGEQRATRELPELRHVRFFPHGDVF